MLGIVGRTDDFVIGRIRDKGISEENAIEILGLIHEIRYLRTVNTRVLNMLNGRYPKKEDGALKKYSGKEITATGVFISQKNGISLFRQIQIVNKKVVDHAWIKTGNEKFENGDYVEIKGTVNKYLGKARTAIDGEVKEQYGIIDAKIRLISKQIFKRE